MPIYGYRCNTCGFQKDHMQKLGDAPLVVCPACGKETYIKQLSAPMFELKGNGWYATDFKGSSVAAAASETADAADKGSTDGKAESSDTHSCGGHCSCGGHG